jgi:predicted outer membrane lipoprotein
MRLGLLVAVAAGVTVAMAAEHLRSSRPSRRDVTSLEGPGMDL